MTMTKAIMVAGLAGGSGKSVVSVGLTAVLSNSMKKKVIPFKKGPDYIDAGWLKIAAGKDCYNLDPYFMEQGVIQKSFSRKSHGADYAVIEGNRGLYDGVNADGGYSSAELSLTLDVPVVLVINCTKTTRTVAALVLGCMHLDERVNICGVVLNQVATGRQKKIITEAIEKYTGLPVFGAIPRMKKDIFPMRHLGMLPHQEYKNSRGALEFLQKTMTEHVDVQAIIESMVEIETAETPEVEEVGDKLRVGILQDAAFQFYYSENLEALKREGAELIFINALKEKVLPELDGLYIGGGFPETSAKELSLNKSFRKSLKEAARSGLPIYAECGGLIYLGESIELDEEIYPLAGVFPVEFGMSKKPQAHGYSVFVVTKDNPFYPVGTRVKGHEFRYSTIKEYGGDVEDLSIKMERGTGFLEKCDGLTTKNVLAMYTHVHAEGTPEWAKGFIECMKTNK